MRLKDRLPSLRERILTVAASCGARDVRVFGSVARGDANANSDVDLLADFDKSKRVTLVTMGNLESRLADLLGVRVELSSADWMREPVRKQALCEAVFVF